jgi:hypothetical protein
MFSIEAIITQMSGPEKTTKITKDTKDVCDPLTHILRWRRPNFGCDGIL